MYIHLWVGGRVFLYIVCLSFICLSVLVNVNMQATYDLMCLCVHDGSVRHDIITHKRDVMVLLRNKLLQSILKTLRNVHKVSML